MKKFLIISVFIIVWAYSATAQTSEKQYKQQIKERKEMLKYTDKVIETKRTKEAKKAAKIAQKEGWKPFPGEKNLVSQIDERMRIEALSDKGSEWPTYIVGTGSGKSSNIQSAFDQAKARVASDVARNFGVEIDEVIDESSNEVFKDDEVHELRKYISESTQYISKKLKNIHNIVKMYRQVEDNKVEVVVYSYTDFAQAKDALLDKMDGESAALRAKLDKLIQRDK